MCGVSYMEVGVGVALAGDKQYFNQNPLILLTYIIKINNGYEKQIF